MAVRTIAGNNETIASNETYVSSNLSQHVRVYLPKINDGTGGTIAVGKEIRVESLGTASIEIVTLNGMRVGIVQPRSKAVVVAVAGQQQSEPTVGPSLGCTQRQRRSSLTPQVEPPSTRRLARRSPVS